MSLFIDETWIKTDMAPLRGWGPKGQRLCGFARHGKWRAITFLAARRRDQLTAPCVTAPCVFDGPINGEGFRASVNQQPVPTGFAAQFGLRLDFPLPQTDLAYGHCLGNTRSSEAIQDRGADLDHRNMPIKVASDNMLESRWESLSYTHL